MKPASLRLREPEAAQENAAATRDRVTLPAGWYLLTAVMLAPDSSASPVFLAVSLGDGMVARRLVAPVRATGTWSCVVAFATESSALRLETDADEPYPGLADLQVRQIGKPEAAARMLFALRTRRGVPHWARLSSLALSAVRALVRWQPRAFPIALTDHYQQTFTNGPRLAPTLDCRVRRRGWPIPADRLEARHGADLVSWFDSRGRAGWSAVSDDPQFHIGGPPEQPLPGGWYRFRAKFELVDGDISCPCIYPDYGGGMNQGSIIQLPSPDHSGLVDAVIVLRNDAKSLRIDPTIRQARFRFLDLGLMRLTRAEAVVRMLCGFRVAGRARWHAIGAAARGAFVQMLGKGTSAAGEELHRHYRAFLFSNSADYASWVKLYDTLTPASLKSFNQRAMQVSHGPLISILLPVYETPERWLRRCIDSVVGQAYPNWELCIVDDASPSERVRRVLSEYARRDPRVRVEFRPVNGHISEASNTALAMARGSHVGLLDHDDELRPHALLEVVEAIARSPQACMVYSDEDKIDEHGRRFEPNFKPDWNPDLLRSQNYVCHFTVLDACLARDVGGFRKGYEGSQDHDLILRCSERLEPSQILHVPKVLYHWRAIEGSTALRRDAKDYASDAGSRAVADHLVRTAARARVEQLPHGHYRVRWPLPDPAPMVSLVVPTRDKVHLLRTCVESILGVTDYHPLELLVVDNQSSDPETLEYLESLGGRDRVRVLRYDAEFNYSAINNFAVRHAEGSIIGLVNNDIEVLSPDWLRELASHAARPDIGAVGTMLYYPDGSIQHAGVVLGIGGVANHAYARQPRGYPGHGARALVAQNLSAVTGACLLVRRELYDSVGGLDEALAVAFNDIDFCLRLRQRGYRNLWTPFTHIIHHESASRGSDDTDAKQARFAREVALMNLRWGGSLYSDPAYNINLTLDDVDFGMAFPPRSTQMSANVAGQSPVGG